MGIWISSEHTQRTSMFYYRIVIISPASLAVLPETASFIIAFNFLVLALQ